MSSGTVNVVGVDMSETGAVTHFSVPFVVFNMIAGGLGWFTAILWSGAFQSALDAYKDREKASGNITNPIWLNLLLAFIGTLFSIGVLYLMIKAYQQVYAITTRINSSAMFK